MLLGLVRVSRRGSSVWGLGGLGTGMAGAGVTVGQCRSGHKAANIHLPPVTPDRILVSCLE